MLNISKNTGRRGITAIEAVVGVSIAAFVLVAVTHAIVRFLNVGRDIADQTQALYLAEEGLEMVRFIRDGKWSRIGTLTDGATYYLSISGSTIATSTSPEVIGDFTRSFVVDSVERDGSDDIVVSGSPDSDSRYVTATVAWGSGKTVSLTTIIADINNP